MRMNDLNKFITESQQLLEGVKFGEKEIQNILSRSKDFNIGIEYEILPSRYKKDDLDYDLKERGLYTEVRAIVPEHDSMVEVITNKLTLTDGLNHIKGMFEYLSDSGIEVPEFSGMHISISTNKYMLDKFNPVKFYLLMDSDFIHNLFPVREHVSNSAKKLKRSVIDMIEHHDHIDTNNISSKMIEEIEKSIKVDLGGKYQTINIGDYAFHDGRIELRFFGGQNYHTMYDNIKRQLLRSLFILELAYTDLYKKEYYKELGKLIVSAKSSLSLSPDATKKNREELLKRIQNDDGFGVVLMLEEGIGIDPNNLPPKLKNKIEEVIKDKADASLYYAELTGKPFPKGEDAIAKDTILATRYSRIFNERFERAEEQIFSSGGMPAVNYYSDHFSPDYLPENLERIFSENAKVSAWMRYVRLLKGGGRTTEDIKDKLPGFNPNTVAKELSDGISDVDAIDYVVYCVVTPNNINEVIKRSESYFEDIYDYLWMLIKEYVIFYESVEDITEVNRITLLEEAVQLGDVFSSYHTLNNDEKMALVKGLKKYVIDTGLKDEEKIFTSVHSIVSKKMSITSALRPFDDEFRTRYKEYTGHELPDESES